MAVILAACLSLAAEGASAQGFENVFGPPATADSGARRVTPVRVCPGGGFIAVGTTNVGTGPTSNVYVVRTTAAGTPMFERSYDLGPNTIDRGAALAEANDGSGFIITGTTRVLASGATDEVLLMKITCYGVPLWASAYLSVRPDFGLDVIEARTGSPVYGTQPGDIVVAGYTINNAGDRDGLLMRTRSNGTLIWNQRYNSLGAQEIFRGVTEALPTPGGNNPTGDIVTVGQTSPIPGYALGYVVRVNGNNGGIGGAPQGAVRHGIFDPLVFESVTELRAPGLVGQLVIAGHAHSTATRADIFLVRTTAYPAAVASARRIGDLAGAPIDEEVAVDVHEVANPLPAASQGSLALTGRVGRAATTMFDAFLLIANRYTLAPAGTGQLFGDHGNRFDSGASVADHANGFILAGSSSSDFEGVGDPGDLYLVGTDANGETSCSQPWTPPSNAASVVAERIITDYYAFLQQAPRTVQMQPLYAAARACP